MQFDSDRPIYLQIADRFAREIVSGEWPPGGRVPAVRDLALAMGVNPNTMQRAMAELEQQKLLYTERTAGRFVTQDEALLKQLWEDSAQKIIRQFILDMERLGCPPETLSVRIQNELEKEKSL